MFMRGILALGLATGFAGSAAAGEYGCGGHCYRQATLPPVYGTLTEPVQLSAPRTYAVVNPPEYRTIAEPVQVAPARREWRITRDAWGRRVGCWVEIPARYAVLHRPVMVRSGSVVPETTFPVYGVRYRSVKMEPARRAWVPRAYATFVEAGFGANY
jgi:hypothetical protein